MPLTPQITLSVNLLDFSGNQVGSSTQPAYVRIALVGYGGILPRVNGTGMVAKVATNFQDVPYTGAPISIPLWGNDVITPSGTYYLISILDAGKNVVQAATYQFTGSGTKDLSAQSPYLPPTLPSYIPNAVVTNPTGKQTIAGEVEIDGALDLASFLNFVLSGVTKYQIFYDGASSLFLVDPSSNIRLELDDAGATYLKSLGSVPVLIGGASSGNLVQFIDNFSATKAVIDLGGNLLIQGLISGGSVTFGSGYTWFIDNNGILQLGGTTGTFIANGASGKITKYNGISTAGLGMASLVAVLDLTAQNATLSGTLYAVPASGAGQYRVVFNAKVTTAAGTSSTLGGMSVSYTDPDGVAVTVTILGQTQAGAAAASNTGNTTGSALFGHAFIINCKASTNITYTFNYASNPANAMQYNLHARLESL